MGPSWAHVGHKMPEHRFDSPRGFAIQTCYRAAFRTCPSRTGRRRRRYRVVPDGAAGRPPIDRDLRELIRRMARDNPTWGRRRIKAELHFLGYDVAELTVSKYMRRRRSPRPSPTWRSFLEAHLKEIAGIDFFVVPTLTFRLLFGFIVLRHDRRQLVHINVTDHPTAEWTAQQIVDAFPYDSSHRYLLRDRDTTYAATFTRRIAGLGIRELLITPRAPWQNPFAERLIGSIRRECLDNFIVFNERHLRRLLRGYVTYYNTVRHIPSASPSKLHS